MGFTCAVHREASGSSEVIKSLEMLSDCLSVGTSRVKSKKCKLSESGQLWSSSTARHCCGLSGDVLSSIILKRGRGNRRGVAQRARGLTDQLDSICLLTVQ